MATPRAHAQPGDRRLLAGSRLANEMGRQSSAAGCPEKVRASPRSVWLPGLESQEGASVLVDFFQEVLLGPVQAHGVQSPNSRGKHASRRTDPRRSPPGQSWFL